MLGEIISSGTVLDAAVSDELVTNIFFKNSPLHDGAMVIRRARIHAAGCYLPLSQNTEIARELGTRHRAALGMSENSDSVVIVVSEETGAISAACESRLTRDLSPQALHDLLREKLAPPDAKPASRRAGHEE
jgi:diadenylate cyclase